MSLHKSSENLRLVGEIEASLLKTGFAILVRAISSEGEEILRFVYDPLNDLVIPYSGLPEWLLEFCKSEKDSAIAELKEPGGRGISFVAERIRGRVSLCVFGAGHVGQAVALMGALVGYEVTIVDDRSEFASRKWIPDPRVKLIVGNFEKEIKSLRLGNRSAAVIVTRGHQYDEICLRELLRYKLSYLGMIGSKRRVLSIFNRLRLEGFSPDDFSRVHAPIGLAIGAMSPQEIAVAIIAEIISEINKREGK